MLRKTYNVLWLAENNGNLNKRFNKFRKGGKEGVDFSVGNETIKFVGTVVAMADDNLGSHQIGGFIEKFHFSEYFCRFCDIT